MIHSIIIPHRRRQPYLAICLESLRRAMHQGDYGVVEILVVNAGPAPWMPMCCRVIQDDAHPEVFNKPRLLNIGMDQAIGDVLTFLDCDAIVGPQWLEGVELVDWADTMRLCYRVRYLNRQDSDRVIAGSLDPWAPFSGYDRLRLGFEAYGSHCTTGTTQGQPWGNSQFSVHRRWLADLRFDEEFRGRGFEDLDWLHRFEHHWGEDYRGQIRTDGPHSLLHLTHDYSDDWMRAEFTNANLARYKA